MCYMHGYVAMYICVCMCIYLYVYIFVFMYIVYTHIPIYKYFLALFVEKDKKP